MNASTIVQVDALHSGYGEAMVLKGLNLTLARGEVVVILGKNGMG
ncbi:MAG: hypothetical protein QOG58_728, partial [Caballeronia sp.]|nr:hypothetical protein [Caballeronia sp.]